MRAIIFDMDGTLLDSSHAWDGLADKYLEEIGIKPLKSLHKTMETMTTDESAAYLIDKYELEYTNQEIKKRFYELIKEIYEEEVDLKSGVRDYLEEALSKDIDMCIVTAASRELVEIVLERFKLESYFKFIMTLEEEGLHKRSPEIYLRAADRLGYRRQDIIIFEDSLHAIKSAKQAGFKVIGVHDSSSASDEMKMRKLVDGYIYNFKDKILK